MNANSILHLETTKKGSVLLFVMLITGCLLSTTMGYWYSGSRNYELMIERMRYEQHFRLTEGALNCGVAYACHHFNELQKKHEYSVDLNEYAQLLGDTYRAQLTFLSQRKSVLIKAATYVHKEKVCCMQCRLQKGDTDAFAVSGWKIGEQ